MPAVRGRYNSEMLLGLDRQTGAMFRGRWTDSLHAVSHLPL